MTIHATKRTVIAALILLGIVDLVALGVLLSPLAKSRQQREAELHSYQEQLKQKKIDLGPSQGMDKKIAAASVDIASFYKQRLPGQYSQIDAALSKAAQANNVQLQSVSYKADRKQVEDLERVDVDMTISGPYVNDVKFINAVERDKVFFVINSVSLVGSSSGIQLLVKAETYFKVGAA